MDPEQILNSLHLGKYYYCDQGAHAGEWHVELNGYLTDKELHALQGFWSKD